MRGQLALWHQLDEKFQRAVFIGRGHDRVGPLDALVRMVDHQGCILTGLEREWSSWIHPYEPQILGEILTLYYGCRVVLIQWRDHCLLFLPRRRYGSAA